MVKIRSSQPSFFKWPPPKTFAILSEVPHEIKISGVSKYFPSGIQALAGLSFDVQRCEFVSILGPSGCGKSTLLRLLGGLEKPTTGSITIPRDLQKFGFVFQDAHLLPWRSLEENILLPLEFERIPHSEQQSKLRDILKLVGLEEFRLAYPAQLSGGMKMRASLARALITEPKILLLDEPFAALDEALRKRLDLELRRIWKSLGITIFFVTHSVSEAVFISNRLILLSARPGRLVKDEMVELPEDRGSDLKWNPEFLRRVNDISIGLELSEESR